MKTLPLHLLALAVLLSVGSAPLPAGPLSGGSRPERTRPAAPPERSRTRPESAPAKPAGENLSEQQKANLQALQADLAAIKSGWAVTPEQKTAVRNSLAAIADGATKPSEASVSALADSLTTALSDQTVSMQEKAQITKNVQAVLQSANIPAEEVEALIASTSALLTATGVSKDEATAVADDLRAIAAEIKASASAAAAGH